MVLIVSGTVLEEVPSSLNSLFQSHPSLKDSANALCSMKSQVIGPAGLLYVSQREYAVTHPHDNKVSIIGTDDVTTNVILIVRHTGSGITLLSQVDRLKQDDVDTMLQKVAPTNYGYDNRIKVHLIGAFADSKNISETLTLPILDYLHRSRIELDLVTCCVGEVCTVHRNGTPWPVIYGAGVNVKTGDIFPAQFTDKGPDMDIRNARTLTGGENVGMLDVYDCAREEMRIGPFTYEPMRAVDIWLEQTDNFLLQSLSPSPAVTPNPDNFVCRLRATLKKIKEHPYPSVTLFPSNMPRSYRKDDVTGLWMNKDDISSWQLPLTQNSHHIIKGDPHLVSLKHEAQFGGFKDEFNINFNFKQEAYMPWPQPIPIQTQSYY